MKGNQNSYQDQAGSGGQRRLLLGVLGDDGRVGARWKINGHAGAIRGMVWLNEVNYASYAVATPLLLANPPPPGTPAGAEITIPAAAFAIRNHYGIGLNWEQEVTKDIGVFYAHRVERAAKRPWTYTDANWSASLGASIKGQQWCRPGRTPLVSSASLAAHWPSKSNSSRRVGTGILNGDGNLTYGSGKLWKPTTTSPSARAAASPSITSSSPTRPSTPPAAR